MIAPAHYGQIGRDCSGGRRRRVELKLSFELERLKPAALDSRSDLGAGSGAKHDIDAETLSHSLAFRQLREASHKAERERSAAFFFSQLAQKGLNFFDGLAAHGARVDQHEIGLTEVFRERITYARKLRLNGVRVILVHLTAECYDMRSHKRNQ
jgi:hypothetical protein